MVEISFCTTVMNRLSHLKETLPVNLYDNRDCPDLEIVLLDYNSDDGLEDYIYANYRQDIDSKRLVYYRSETPKYFNRSHSRNLAFRLANGRILCNIDADNYTGKGFASYVKGMFDSNNGIFLSTSDLTTASKRDCLGRICVLKEDFLKVGGFDEQMSFYGFEDHDLVYRLSMAGLRNTIIADKRFLTAIEHSNAERLKNETPLNFFSALYINYIDTSHSELLLTFNDLHAKIATIQNNRTLNSMSVVNRFSIKFEISVIENEWIGYESSIHRGQLILKNATNAIRRFDIKQDGNLVEASGTQTIFYKIESPEFIEEVLLFYSEITNRLIMESNLRNKLIFVNPEGFGKDSVFKNFTKDNFVTII